MFEKCCETVNQCGKSLKEFQGKLLEEKEIVEKIRIKLNSLHSGLSLMKEHISTKKVEATKKVEKKITKKPTSKTKDEGKVVKKRTYKK